MTDERFYCLSCRVPVEFCPEIESYTCGRCEGVFDKREVLPAHLIEPDWQRTLDSLLEVRNEKT